MAKKPSYRAGRDQAATAENVELLTGQRGDRLDKAVTFRELAALGLSTLRPGAGGVYVPSKNPDLFPPGQMEFPHAPVNVIANGAFHTVLVEWDPPQYRGHAHAEIWRAESDNQAAATLVGTSSANLYSDAIGKDATFYYWVRFVNGKDDKGPFQGVQGVEAETSRDVQDILDELQGKIEKSHLVQELLRPIEDVSQLQMEVSLLKPKIDEIEIRIPGIEEELAGLDERQKAAQDLLDDAQQQLGMSSIEIGLMQDRLNAKLDKYKGDFDSFRDAVFVVDPENGSITMDAVNAVRDELHTSITEVHQELDAVAGQISSKADNVTVDSQGSRITEAEQRINGLDASLSQTVTKGEFTKEQQKVTQIGQELDATKGELTQKATKQEVDAQGERLANAESKLTAHTDELSSQAQRIDGLAAQITLGDETLQANITELARVTAESDQVTAQRVSGLEVRAGTSEAKIQALEEIIEDDGGITAGRFDTITAELELQRGLDDDNASAAIDGALAVDERDRETRKAFGSIRTEQRVILTEQQAQAQRTIDIDVKFEAKDAATQARISSVEKVTSDADSALAQRIENVTAEFKAADTALAVSLAESSKALADADQALGERISTIDVKVGENTASITELQRVVASNEESLSQRQDKMESEIGIGAVSQVEGALAGDERDRENRKARGVILQQQSTLANQQEAQARTVEQLTAEFDAENAEIRAQITNEQMARATADEALAQKTSVLEAQIEGVDQSLSASIAEVARVSADATQALGSQINTVSAVAGSKNKTFFQATAPGSEMGTGDLWFDTASNNRPYRYSGTAWIATDDPRIAANAAAVQLQSQAIADLQSGAQAMWTAKASAGQITAGIGLIAKSDGTSQVAISASQVFVFNPNSSTPMAPLFAIDNGQAVIAEAIIRKATIQILNAEKITADYVKAGVSISSPLINGGQIDMGNAFMAGGAAGFGKGGPYGGWGWGWHTIIYADGGIYTNRLYAEGGYVRNMTIGNCTIEQNCIVHGTVYAERIVGDVAAIKSLYMQQPSGPFSMFFNVVPANFARGIIVTGINIKAAGYYYGSGGQPSEGTRTCTVVFYMNGVEFGRESVSATGGSRKDSATASATVTLPAGVYGQFQVSILGDVSVSLTGAVAMVFKHGSATFG
ncbi:phage tail tip protein [Aeromonas media]|uniref:phage tail tip fiber protein n=1 Tax=Aeromonas media TaxID=651 RepID=UPI00384D17DA